MNKSECEFIPRSRVCDSAHCAKMALLTEFRACLSGCDFQKVYALGVSEQVLFNSLVLTLVLWVLLTFEVWHFSVKIAPLGIRKMVPKRIILKVGC